MGQLASAYLVQGEILYREAESRLALFSSRRYLLQNLNEFGQLGTGDRSLVLIHSKREAK
jgi:hypothetical protein